MTPLLSQPRTLVHVVGWELQAVLFTPRSGLGVPQGGACGAISVGP